MPTAPAGTTVVVPAGSILAISESNGASALVDSTNWFVQGPEGPAVSLDMTLLGLEAAPA